MGLFDIFGGKSPEKALQKAAKHAANKRAQAVDRWEAIQELSRMGTSEAVEALLPRFTFYTDPSITDAEEKDAAFNGVVGAGEAAVAPVLAEHPVQVGYYPHDGEVEVRLVAKCAGASAAVEAAAAAIHAALGADGYRPPGEGRVAAWLVDRLTQRGESLAIAESLTGGLLARLITQVSGSSAVFRAGVVTYATEAKDALLGVSPALVAEHGVVSEAVAAAMAEGVRKATDATHALATTGVAGPGDWTQPDGRVTEAGTVCFGLATASGTTATVTKRFHANREGVQRRAAQFALDLLRRHIDRG